MTNLTEKITAYIAENPQAITLDMAAHCELPEGKMLPPLLKNAVRSLKLKIVSPKVL